MFFSVLQRLEDKMRPPRRLSFTRGGKYFAGMTLLVGLGAINTGTSLLFLVLGMMLSLIVASGLLSEAVLRELTVRRELPDRAFAGQAAPGQMVVDNPKFYPSLSLEVVEMAATCRVGPLAGQSLGRTRHPWWRLWQSGNADDGGAVGQAYTIRLEAGEQQALEASYSFPRRGVYELSGLALTTRFPFSFFEKAREQRQSAEMVVFPPPADPGEWDAEFFGQFGDVSAGEAGRGDEYFGLREYRPGEDKRLIHWKSSASRGELVIREQERETSRSIVLHLANATGRPARQRHLAISPFERAIERLAGLIERCAARGWEVGLRTFDDEVPVASAQADALHYALATTELHDEVPDRSLRRDGEEESADVLVAFAGTAGRIGGGWDAVLEIEQSTDTDEADPIITDSLDEPTDREVAR
jgi:uncharacterized protein (DUF58 family)